MLNYNSLPRFDKPAVESHLTYFGFLNPVILHKPFGRSVRSQKSSENKLPFVTFRYVWKQRTGVKIDGEHILLHGLYLVYFCSFYIAHALFVTICYSFYLAIPIPKD